MRLSQACGLRSEIFVEGSDGWEDREVKTDSSRRGGIEVGGLSGRSVRGPGELLLEGGEGRKDVGVEATRERVGRAERTGS